VVLSDFPRNLKFHTAKLVKLTQLFLESGITIEELPTVVSSIGKIKVYTILAR
jgi:hypothetical protein